MKVYKTPKLVIVSECNKEFESILPSVGAVTGAMHMVARSAAKAAVQEPRCKSLQSK